MGGAVLMGGARLLGVFNLIGEDERQSGKWCLLTVQWTLWYNIGNEIGAQFVKHASEDGVLFDGL